MVKRRSNQLPGSVSVIAAPAPPQTGKFDFNVWMLSHPEGSNLRCFTDIMKSVADSIRALNYTVVESFGSLQYPSSQLVILGANVIHDHFIPHIPKNAIIYQLEQLGPHNRQTAAYIDLLRKHTVWDFSERNIEFLKSWGCQDVHLCRIGYSPHPVPFRQDPKDIDVLFLGQRNERRDAILRQLRATGLVVHDTGAWGDERRDLVARAKIVLNLHYFADSVLEMVRLGPMLEQGAFIISEHGADRALEAALEGGVIFAPPEKIVSTIGLFMAAPDSRRQITERAAEIFKKISQKTEVARCLTALGYACPKKIKCFIINRDRLTWTKNTVQEIRRLGGEPIIVDNLSSYPPLLEWYATGDCRVIRLDKNIGARAAWLSGLIHQEVGVGELYVVTDPDLDLSGVPDDTLAVLARGLDGHKVTKAGLSLELKDVPPHLLAVVQMNGRTLEQCEIGYWQEKVDAQFFKAATDTTFAMYRHEGKPHGAAEFFEAVRSDRPYTARHLPWYRTEADFDDEDRYYVAHREKFNSVNGTWYDSVVAK